jgi:hypothetical protein
MTKAEEMYQRALAGYGIALGPDHTSTLSAVNNPGVLYSDQGKMAEAEEMYQRALATKEKALGPNHTLTLDTSTILVFCTAMKDSLLNVSTSLTSGETSLSPCMEVSEGCQSSIQMTPMRELHFSRKLSMRMVCWVTRISDVMVVASQSLVLWSVSFAETVQMVIFAVNVS